MEVLIILIAIGIIGYVVFQNLPSSKYALANKLISQGKIIEASMMLEKLLGKHPDAPAKLAECFYIKGTKSKSQEDFSDFIKVFELKKRLQGSYNRDLFERIEAKAAYEIALDNYTKAWKLASSFPIEGASKLKENIQYINGCIKNGVEHEFSTLINNHFVQISEIYFERGKNLEKENKLLDAINNYSEAISNQPNQNKSQNYFDIIARRQICKIKIGEVQEYNNNGLAWNDINNASHKIRTDFYYRYILKLCGKDNVLAEELTKKYLPPENETSKVLKNYFTNFRKKIAKARVDDINRDLEELFNNQFPVAKTKVLYASLDKTVPSITSVFPELKPKLEEIKPSLFNKLLIRSIENQDYENAINLIVGFPNFWSVPELLKNLGICCFGITNQGKLTNDNYELVIASWLTAIHSDGVILKSLDSTSWDDEYTFSLKDSIGSRYGNHSNIPGNANYEDISDSNISIGATQRELLVQFENAINKFQDEVLSRKLHHFYGNEKNAIEKVINIVANEVLFASPYFAKKFQSVAENIICQLNDDYSESSNEEVLEAGVPYYDPVHYSGSYSDTVGEYYQATIIRREFMTALKALKTDKLMEINKDSDKEKTVNKYGKFRESFEEEIFNFFNSKIEENDENEKLIAPLAQSINLFKSANKLRYQYSNFVTNLTVAKVNEDTMDNFNALQNMRNAYLCKMDIARVCKNLIAIIRINLFDIINDRTNKASDIYKILDEIKKKKSAVYKNHCSELTKAGRELLAQFPADARTLILAGTNLNAEGQKIKKALQYMVEMGDGDDFTDLFRK